MIMTANRSLEKFLDMNENLEYIAVSAKQIHLHSSFMST